MKFSALQVGQFFTVNGCAMEKKSSRTAYLLQFNGYKYTRQGLWYYCSANECVTLIGTTIAVDS